MSTATIHATTSSTANFPKRDGLDIEPDEKWKARLKQNIDDGLTSMVKDAKDNLEQSLRQPDISEDDRGRFEAEYNSIMHNVRKIATEAYHAELDRERNERRWAAAMPANSGWSEALQQEQKDILEAAKRNKEGGGVSASPTASPIEDRRRTLVASRAAAERASTQASDALPTPPTSAQAEPPSRSGSISERNSARSPPKSIPAFWKPSITPEEDALMSRPSLTPVRRNSSVSLQSNGFAGRRPSTVQETILERPETSSKFTREKEPDKPWNIAPPQTKDEYAASVGQSSRKVNGVRPPVPQAWVPPPAAEHDTEEEPDMDTEDELMVKRGPRSRPSMKVKPIWETEGRPIEPPSRSSSILERNSAQSPSKPLPAFWKPSVTPEEDAATSRLFVTPVHRNATSLHQPSVADNPHRRLSSKPSVSFSENSRIWEAVNGAKLAEQKLTEQKAKEKEEELRRRAEEIEQKEAAARRKEEIAMLMEEEARQKLEAAKQREEEARLKVEEVNLKAEAAMQKERGVRIAEDDIKRKTDEIKKIGDELTVREEDLRQKGEIMMGKEKDIGHAEEEVRRTAEIQASKEDVLVQKEQQLKLWEDKLARREEELKWYIDAREILTNVCSNKTKYDQLLSLDQSNLQLVLDLMQMVLEHSYTRAYNFENVLLKSMLRVAKRHTLCPRSYVLNDIEHGAYPIASGHFGEVFQGDYDGRKLSLKVFKLYTSEMSKINQLIMAFYKEAILWRHLSHRNLLPFYGIYQLRDPVERICLVSPWMKEGNVTQYLERNPQANRRYLALDVARGISYLHRKSIVHGDLKGVNVLVSDAGVACLADFGLASVIVNTPAGVWSSSTVSNAGTVRWQAPELIGGSDGSFTGRTKESDIYAFACVCYEIFVGKMPFYEILNDVTVMHKVMTSGQRPLRPEVDSDPYIQWGLTDWMWSLIEECWSQDPATRPLASDVVTKLSSRKEFLRDDDDGHGDWGDLQPEMFRSLVHEQHTLLQDDIQRCIALLNTL